VGNRPSDEFHELVSAMKRVAAILREADLPVLLGGGMAVWARGGPATLHDVDFYVRPDDADRALDVLAEAGLRSEKPPEGWLYKVWDGEQLVDLIFEPSGGPIDDGYFDRAEHLEVMAQPLLVAAVDDLLTAKLLSLREQELDYQPVLEIARSLREQIDWSFVRERTDHSPFARAFFTLVEELGVLTRVPGGERDAV
jgi:hypothetical protein